ncbi:platelet binding protein GspB-like isoform X2 [Dreissena polymorpha]|uniref:platelet binding protein GspB-like isoform X2 n=1 Tax=Dreissena polymorpha TaxID=45954 RepID=UPI00226439D1|nr:platelet binding protein GspB-like isoform X2 [Dreissena polymorpha]
MVNLCNLCLKIRVQVVKRGHSQKFLRAQCALEELIHNADDLNSICLPCLAKLEGLITFKRFIEHNIQVKKRKRPAPPDVHDYATKKIQFEIQTHTVSQTDPKIAATSNTATLKAFSIDTNEKVTTTSSFATTSTTATKTVTSSLPAHSVQTITASAVTARASSVSATIKALTSHLTASAVSARASNASTTTAKSVTSSLPAHSVPLTTASAVTTKASPVSTTTAKTVTSSLTASSVLTSSASTVSARASYASTTTAKTVNSKLTALSVLTSSASAVNVGVPPVSARTLKPLTSCWTSPSVLTTTASEVTARAATALTTVSATQPTAKAKALVTDKPRDYLHEPTTAPTSGATGTVTESESVTAKEHVDHCYAEMNNWGTKELPEWKKKFVAMPFDTDKQKKIIDVVKRAVSMLAENKNSILFNIAPGVSGETVFSDAYAELKLLAKLNKLHITLSEHSKRNIMKELKCHEYNLQKVKEGDDIQLLEPPPEPALFSNG